MVGTWGWQEFDLQKPWKFISRLYPAFHLLVRAVVKGGNLIRFWEDCWWGFSSLKERFPSLFQISVDFNKPICYFYSVGDSSVNSNLIWDVQFRRDFNEFELVEFITLLGVLDSGSLEEDNEDLRVWL